LFQEEDDGWFAWCENPPPFIYEYPPSQLYSVYTQVENTKKGKQGGGIPRSCVYLWGICVSYDALLPYVLYFSFKMNEIIKVFL
jgi:hypothetical protein